MSSDYTADLGQIKSGAPTPWTGEEEPVPIGGSDDNDLPFVIRDAGGKMVLCLYERYGAKMEPLHVELGKRIVSAMNAYAAEREKPR